MLYETTKILHQTPEAERVVAELLAHLRVMFRSDVAELTLLSSTQGQEHLRAASRDDGVPPALVAIGTDIDDPLLRHAIETGRPELVTMSDPASAPRFRNAMVAPLHGEHRIIGTLVVADRMSDISTFDVTDMAMFETLASHIAVSLENDQLEASLKRLAELKEELRHQANHDALTGLANRALFIDAVEARLKAAEPGGPVLVVLFLDLDDFKVVNDTMGHPTGDGLLRSVGQRISETVRGEDVAARLGGDEFAVMLWDREDLIGSRRLAERLLANLSEPYRIDSSIVSIRASIGVASGLDGSISARDLMKHADVAMYAAKASGKGRVVFFEQAMAANLEHRTSTVAALRQAIAADQLVLHYLPVVDLRTSAIVGTEALVRWDDPRRGLVPPLEFIGLAEESDLILDLGDWVLQRALDQMSAWQALGEPFRTWWMSVNISSRQLGRDGFVVGIARAVRRSGVAPGSLALELTESGLIADADGASQKLSALREIGIRVLLDDFGTGYSSLAYLQRFPVSALKIAREFVDVDPDDESAWALSAAVIAMARTLGLDVIAEGVEQPGQLQRLSDLGCTQAQGFLLARPAPAAEIEASYGRSASKRPRLPASAVATP
jgi:diguanylate cyclase (GGDEF)-like protein